MAGTRNRSARRAADDDTDPGPRMQRWTEQRWLLDNTIRAVGPEWDQPRLGNYATACGPLVTGDIAALRARIQKHADINPAFEAAARRREAMARSAEADAHPVSARDNYFAAAVFWAASQWPLLANDAHNKANNTRKRECFLAYARLADHTIEAVSLALPGKGKATIRGWLHLPYGHRAGQRVPAVVSIPGMDGFKESNVALLGDRWLSRGIAVLVIDGPGQYEAALEGVWFSVPAWKATGRAAFAWLAARADIDSARIGIVGNSFGSFFATIAAAWEPRYRAIAVSSICLEPGGHTIFEEASPTFKRRFMYMAGVADEAAFEPVRKTITWRGHSKRIAMPYLCVAGERDELCPIIWADRMLATVQGPRQLVVYQESRHTVGNVASAQFGPNPAALVADWMHDRLSEGKGDHQTERKAARPLTDGRWFVESSGNVVKGPFNQA